MQPASVKTPEDSYYRIGRKPDPLAFVDWPHVGSGRFDDPNATPTYRVLYAGERRACFYECLQNFRPDLSGLVTAKLSQEWADKRSIATFVLQNLKQDVQWLNLQSPTTLQFFRQHLAQILMKNGVADFDYSTACGPMRPITREIGSFAFSAGYAGIIYHSRLAPEHRCLAVFERTTDPLVAITSQSVDSIELSDPDLISVATDFGIQL